MLFILKLLEEKNISITKFKRVKITLETSEKLFEVDNDDDTIKSLKNINLYNKINNVIKSLNADTCYSYLIYQYLDIFGENSKNFQEIFQIIISSIYHQNIKCDFTFDFDENYYNNVINFINSLQNEMNNKLYYEELYKFNNISTRLIKKEENEKQDINDIKEKKESIKNVKDVDNDTSECFNINLDKGGNNKTKKEETKKKKIDENDNNNDNNNKNINKYKNGESENNNIEKRKKNKKRKLRNKTKNLRRQREKQNKEKNDNKILDTKNDKSLISNNEEKEIDEEEKSNKDNIINNSNEFSFDINDEKETIIRIDLYDLKNNLKPKEKLQDYFKRMLKYYKIDKNKKYYFLYDLANNDYYSLKNKFIFKINYEKFPFISNMLKFLKEQLEPVRDTNNKEVYKEYQGPDSFGYLIYDKDEYFYVFKNEFNRNLFNYINNVKKYEYDNHYPNRTENDNLDKIDYHFFSSEDFENKINKYFIDLNLKQLPNYFFKLVKKNRKEISFNKDYNKNEIDMNYVDGNYFSSYIEIDGAFAYLNPKKLIIISKESKLFNVSKTLKISSWGDKIQIIDDKDFIIEPNTIILIEDKLSFPKFIQNLTKEKKIKKDEMYASLNFLIYKLIKKIKIFNEYLASTSEGKDISYSYYLLLIYDSNPILNVENIIVKIINDLAKEQLIKYPIFQLKVIYALPCITLNESRRIKELEETVTRLEKEMEKLKKSLISNKKNNYE